jgi:selenide,water dikinase
MKNVQLTKYSHGAGCGCKISPQILDEILKGAQSSDQDGKLLVGHHTRDDAAVYDMGDGSAVISTTDFFMPIVDDPFDFGRIAAVNAINDVYAMGGAPLMAIAILGWPVDKLPTTAAQKVLEGGRHACGEAGISLAGGHSIDNREPVFGLAVTGMVKKENLKRNDTAKPGCLLFLTKPLGTGILTTAHKKGLLKTEHHSIARDLMVQLNRLGEDLGSLNHVRALTDITGFGLLGHLTEMCEGSNVNAVIDFHAVPQILALREYMEQQCIPGGTERNWNSYKHKAGTLADYPRLVLCDPQTSGGLLIALDPDGKEEFEEKCQKHGLALDPIGTIEERRPEGPLVEVRGQDLGE